MNPKLAAQIMLIQILAVSIFHSCILIKIIPYDITWGGRLQTDQEMYVFEVFSLALNFLLGLSILVHSKIIRPIFSVKISKVILWIFFGLFALNTIGNIFAETVFEKVFTVLTLLSCYLIWKILRTSNQTNK